MSHRYSLEEIAGWTIHGVTQYARYLIPLVDPLPEGLNPPSWWFNYYHYHNWTGTHDSAGRPSEEGIRLWLQGCWYLFGTWIDEAANGAREYALDIVRQWVGHWPSQYANFAAWVISIRSMIPWQIRQGIKTWDALIDVARIAAIAWARERVDDLNAQTGQIRSQIFNDLLPTVRWVLNVQSDVNRVLNDPRQFVEQALGIRWQRLSEFTVGALSFYMSLWSNYHTVLHDFLADPLGYLYTRVEQEILKHW